MLSPAVENLVVQLAKLPGIGRRTAQRLAFHLLSVQAEDARELSRAIEEVKARVRFCRECGNLTEEELCEVCTDARRDRSVICVVEQPVDVVSLDGRTSSAGSTTYSAERSRRSTASNRPTSASEASSRGSSAAAWTRSCSPRTRR